MTRLTILNVKEETEVDLNVQQPISRFIESRNFSHHCSTSPWEEPLLY